MATTKKTTTAKPATEKKTTTRRTAKPKLEIVKEEPKQEMNTFALMAARSPMKTTEADLGNGLKVSVRNRLTIYEMLELVRRICGACVDEERGEVHYQMLDFVAKLFITSVYCNIEIPDDFDIAYASLVGDDGIYKRIEGYIEPEQLNAIWEGCRMKLRSKDEMYASAAAKISIDMMHKITELYEMISSVTEHFDGEEALDALKKLGAIV